MALPPIPQPKASTLSPEAVLPAKNWMAFAYGTSVPASWTTLFTVEPTKRRVVTWASFVATDNTDYTLQMRVLSPSSVAYEIAQAQLLNDGEQWRPIKEVTEVTINSGWALQIICSVGGAANVHYYIAGFEESNPS